MDFPEKRAKQIFTCFALLYYHKEISMEGETVTSQERKAPASTDTDIEPASPAPAEATA